MQKCKDISWPGGNIVCQNKHKEGSWAPLQALPQNLRMLTSHDKTETEKCVQVFIVLCDLVFHQQSMTCLYVSLKIHCKPRMYCYVFVAKGV